MEAEDGKRGYSRFRLGIQKQQVPRYCTMETRDQELFCVGDGLQATSAAT